MALTLADEPVSPTDEKKKKAFFRLIITLFVIDILAVIGYLVLVYAFRWDGMIPLLILLVASVFTGMYYQAGKQKIDR